MRKPRDRDAARSCDDGLLRRFQDSSGESTPDAVLCGRKSTHTTRPPCTTWRHTGCSRSAAAPAQERPHVAFMSHMMWATGARLLSPAVAARKPVLNLTLHSGITQSAARVAQNEMVQHAAGKLISTVVKHQPTINVRSVAYEFQYRIRPLTGSYHSQHPVTERSEKATQHIEGVVPCPI